MKKYHIFTYCGLLIGGAINVGNAQDSTSTNIFTGQIAANVYGAGQQTPFWLRSNQFGVVPPGNALSVQSSAAYLFSPLSKRPSWQIATKGEVVANFGSSTRVFIPELYAGLRFKKFLLYVGRKREYAGLSDTTLTSGSFVWSGNALPIPKIQIEISDYLTLGRKLSWIAFKGNYAHGWFGSGRFAYDYFLHQKSLYVRLGTPKSRFKLYGGFNHQVQWGGKTTIDIGTVNNRTFPGSLKDYFFVITGMGGLTGKGGGTNAFDSTNRVGNHLGTLDVGLEIDLRKYNLLLYRQSIYEDGSLFYLINIADGLNGLVLHNLYPLREKGKLSFRKAVFEILNTRNQGGSIFVLNDAKQRGKDDYFNHQQYYDGWAYRGRIIGTPFITHYEDTNRPESPNTNDFANNNRVLVYHLGLEGGWGEQIRFSGKFSYSKNYGTFGYPYPTVPRQFSGLFQATGQINRWKGLEWTAALSWDKGRLYKDTVGFRAGICKNWNTGK